MDNKRILIIGGAGFIGHNLALKLKQKNYDVNIIDGLIVNNINTVIGNLDNLPNPELSHSMLNERFDLLKKNNIPLHVQDARDYNGLSNIINQINPNIIIHLAAVSHANRSNKDPFSTFDHSLRTLENALDNTRNKVDHIIYFSSSMVYGNFKSDKVDENTLLLHTTKRITQPWKEGLKIDFYDEKNNKIYKFKQQIKKLLNLDYNINAISKNYIKHPNKKVDYTVLKIFKDCLNSNFIKENEIEDAIRNKYVSKYFYEKIARN